MPTYILNKSIDNLTEEIVRLEKEIESSELQIEQKKEIVLQKKSQLTHAIHIYIQRRKVKS